MFRLPGEGGSMTRSLEGEGPVLTRYCPGPADAVANGAQGPGLPAMPRPDAPGRRPVEDDAGFL